jgi:hypothetical protein
VGLRPHPLFMTEQQSNFPVANPEGQSLQYALEARGPNKRNYVFDYGKSRNCPHDNLRSVIHGTPLYRCQDCNYVFSIVAAYQQPLHHIFTQSLMIAQSVAKEFGYNAAMEMAHRDVGQMDGTAQKPALPDGMTLEDTMLLFDSIDVTTEDGGNEQLTELYKQMWELPSEERKARVDAIRAKQYQERKAIEEAQRGQLPPEQSGDGTVTEGQEALTGDTVPGV